MTDPVSDGQARKLDKKIIPRLIKRINAAGIGDIFVRRRADGATVATAHGILHTVDLHNRFAAARPAERERILDEAAAGLTGEPGTGSGRVGLDFDDPDVSLNLRVDVRKEPWREYPGAGFSYARTECREGCCLALFALYDGEDITVLTDDDVHGDIDELYALATENMRRIATMVYVVMLEGGGHKIPVFLFHADDPHVRCLPGDVSRRVAEIRSDPDDEEESFLTYAPNCNSLFAIACEDYLMLTPDARREFHGALMQAHHCGHGPGWVWIGSDDVARAAEAEWNDVLEEMLGHRHDDAA